MDHTICSISHGPYDAYIKELTFSGLKTFGEFFASLIFDGENP